MIYCTGLKLGHKWGQNLSRMPQVQGWGPERTGMVERYSVSQIRSQEQLVNFQFHWGLLPTVVSSPTACTSSSVFVGAHTNYCPFILLLFTFLSSFLGSNCAGLSRKMALRPRVPESLKFIVVISYPSTINLVTVLTIPGLSTIWLCWAKFYQKACLGRKLVVFMIQDACNFIASTWIKNLKLHGFAHKMKWKWGKWTIHL